MTSDRNQLICDVTDCFNFAVIYNAEAECNTCARHTKDRSNQIFRQGHQPPRTNDRPTPGDFLGFSTDVLKKSPKVVVPTDVPADVPSDPDNVSLRTLAVLTEIRDELKTKRIPYPQCDATIRDGSPWVGLRCVEGKGHPGPHRREVEW